MKRSNSICSVVAFFVALLGALTFVSGGCGGVDDGNGGTVVSNGTETAAATGALTRAHRRHAPRTTGTTTTTGSTTTGTSPTTGGSPSGGAATSAQDVIAAAQTPDGAAIPQGPGPNGECPPVVVLLGFWSCPHVGDTCSGGAARSCACVATSGEGQLASWTCQ